jgi:hypothetical protein
MRRQESWTCSSSSCSGVAGFSIGWWAAVLGVVPWVVVAVMAVRAMKRMRDRPPADPAAIREELIALVRRSTPWIKAWAFGLLGLTALGVVLVLLAAFQMR